MLTVCKVKYKGNGGSYIRERLRKTMGWLVSQLVVQVFIFF
jgi:hypothetical protein